MDKSTAKLIARNLRHFPQLESFTLTAWCSCSDYDTKEVLSIIFDISPAQDIQICEPINTEARTQLQNIVRRHTYGIRLYKRDHLHENILCKMTNIVSGPGRHKWGDYYDDYDDCDDQND